MSLKIVLKTAPTVPVEAEMISPAKVVGMTEKEVAALPIFHGNQKVELGELFQVSGKSGGEMRVEGDLSRVKYIGAAMSSERLIIDGNVGMHLGAAMSGGEIVVTGNAGDWVGPEMTGGKITIKGNAGHMVGSAIRGALIGIQGGEIIVHGNAGNEIGSAMRRGLICIVGNSGDYTGVNMLAGTVVVLGKLGIRPGAGMKRGSIVSMQQVEMLPTFTYAETYHPLFLRLYLSYLKDLGLPVTDAQIGGQYQRWNGDSIELNRGEILLHQA